MNHVDGSIAPRTPGSRLPHYGGRDSDHPGSAPAVLSVLAVFSVIAVLFAGCTTTMHVSSATSASVVPPAHARPDNSANHETHPGSGPTTTRASGATTQAGTSPSTTGLPGQLVNFPLDDYGGNADQQQAVTEASNILIARCMSAKGFTYSTTSSGLPAPAAVPSGLEEPYGLANATDAALYGYQPGVPFAQRPPPTPQETVTGGNGDVSYNLALQGSPSGSGTDRGCESQAQDELYGGSTAPDPHSLVGNLGAEAENETAINPKVTAAIRGWSTCMAASGFSYTNPSQPLAANWQPAYPSAPSTNQVATAVADVACKQKTNLPLVWQQTEAGYQTQLINRNAAGLQQVKAATDAMIQRAEAVVGKGS